MATRSELRATLLAHNPSCVFCGGTAAATTIEHCPPRALFQFKQWPEGLEFPACATCNHGSGDDDAAVAMLARFSADGVGGDVDGRVEGLIRNVAAQFPGVFANVVPTHLEARQRNRKLGIKPKPGELQQDAAPITLPEEVKRAVNTFARKLGKGLYYKHTNSVFPNDGTLVFNWFTNVELVLHGRYKLFETLSDIEGNAPGLVRGGKYLNDQFEYKISPSSDAGVFLLQAKLGRSFGIVLMGSRKAGPIEESLASLQAEHGREGPIILLQSSVARQ